MAIEKFDKATVKQVSVEITEALQGIAEKYGVTIERGSASFTASDFSLKVKVAVSGAAEKEFAQTAYLIGLKPEDFGKVIRTAGKEFRISGINLRAPKYPVLAENLKDGKSYKFPEATVKALLEREGN